MAQNFQMYAKVIVSNAFDNLEAAGLEAGIIGISKDADGINSYMVMVLETDECFSIPETKLISTDEIMDQSYFYPGCEPSEFSSPESDFFLVHLFAKVESKNEAQGVGQGLAGLLDFYGLTEIFDVKKYKKIPEYFELSISLQGSSLSESNLGKISKTLGDGWVKSGPCLIWNFSEKTAFIDERIKWASLEFIK